jgi:hypothetical protein
MKNYHQLRGDKTLSYNVNFIKIPTNSMVWLYSSCGGDVNSSVISVGVADAEIVKNNLRGGDFY